MSQARNRPEGEVPSPAAPEEPRAPQPEEEPEREPFVPASVEKRIAAWMGIVYALMFFGIITFSLYCPGRSLAGTFPLFLVPVAAAVGVISVYRQVKGTAPGGLALTVVITAVCAAAAAFGILLGGPALASALAG